MTSSCNLPSEADLDSCISCMTRIARLSKFLRTLRLGIAAFVLRFLPVRIKSAPAPNNAAMVITEAGGPPTHLPADTSDHMNAATVITEAGGPPTYPPADTSDHTNNTSSTTTDPILPIELLEAVAVRVPTLAYLTDLIHSSKALYGRRAALHSTWMIQRYGSAERALQAVAISGCALHQPVPLLRALLASGAGAGAGAGPGVSPASNGGHGSAFRPALGLNGGAVASSSYASCSADAASGSNSSSIHNLSSWQDDTHSASSSYWQPDDDGHLLNDVQDSSDDSTPVPMEVLLHRVPRLLAERRVAGWTPLMSACVFGHDRIVPLLLSPAAVAAGVDVNARDINERTALLHSCKLLTAANQGSGNTADALQLRIVQALLQAPGIDVNARDAQGRTALHQLYWQGHAGRAGNADRSADSAVIQLLLKMPGIDTAPRDRDGCLPLDVRPEAS